MLFLYLALLHFVHSLCLLPSLSRAGETPALPGARRNCMAAGSYLQNVKKDAGVPSAEQMESSGPRKAERAGRPRSMR
jgi:hypothetical protein